MIINFSDKKNKIVKRWRNSLTRERIEDEIAFKPYFFIEAHEQEFSHYKVNEFGTNLEYPFEYQRGDWVNLQGGELKKVIVHRPRDVYAARKMWGQTYEADVPITNRYAVDNLEYIPEYEMRKMYWDMEWITNDPNHGDAITCIVAYDNFDSKYDTFVWFPEEELRRIMDTYPHSDYRIFTSEKEMLEAFLTYIENNDPDMLIAWFGLKFDLPKLIHRCIANELDPRRLSPYGEVKGVTWANRTIIASKEVDNYSPVSQPIKGRITLNLDLAFERQWNDAQKGTLPSLALDYVGEIVLDQKKLVSEKFPDKDVFFKRGWLEDTKRYLDYALVDVEILVNLDKKNFTSESILSLQKLLIAPFDACFYVSNMGSIYFMRNASWKAPTGKKGIKIEYDGAMVYDPLSENTNGLHLNVAAFDFAGLYPSMMISRNISWETKTHQPTQFACNLATPRDFSPVKSRVMRYYKEDELGLLPKAVLDLKNLRNDYKKKMRQAWEEGDTTEYKKWDMNQMAVKRLMASFYGVVAYQGFGWADVELAASITASAREAIRSAAFKVRDINEKKTPSTN
jgi:DNA polymerase I